MKKGILASLLLAFGLFSSTITTHAMTVSDSPANSTTKSTNVHELTAEEIGKRFLEIDQKYDVGQELNKKDADFIKKYSKTANTTKNQKSETTIQPLSTTGSTFSGKGSNPSGSVAALTLGSYSLNEGYINQSYSISMTTKMSSGNASKITNSYTHTAYGVVGSGGVGKVYSNSDSSSTTSNSCYSYFADSYTAIVLYYTTVVKSVIEYSGGSFTVKVNPL